MIINIYVNFINSINTFSLKIKKKIKLISIYKYLLKYIFMNSARFQQSITQFIFEARKIKRNGFDTPFNIL